MTARPPSPQPLIAEAIWRRERAAPQPGDRPPAPGALAVVQAFVNTHFDLVEHWGADRLATPDAVAAWLGDRGLLGDRIKAIGPGQQRRAIAFREALRALLTAGNGVRSPHPAAVLGGLDAAVRRVRLRVRFTDQGPELQPAAAAGLDHAIGVLLAVIVAAAGDGSWWRLKACPGEHCGWVFYDASRNNSGRWCSMSVCGGRAKARSHYRRRRTREA